MQGKYGLLFTVLVLTSVAAAIAQLLPPAGELLPLALLLDLVPFGGVIAATTIVTIRIRRASLPLVRLIISMYGYFAGALVGALGSAHVVAVLLGSIDSGQQHEFVYSFRFYSLVLLGALLIGTGVIAAIESERLARHHRGAWRASLSIWTAILAINLPLVPLQAFAVLLSVLAAFELLLLRGMRRHFDGRSSEQNEHDYPTCMPPT